MTVAGGMNNRGWDLPVYVTNIDPNGVVAREGSICKGVCRQRGVFTIGLLRCTLCTWYTPTSTFHTAKLKKKKASNFLNCIIPYVSIVYCIHDVLNYSGANLLVGTELLFSVTIFQQHSMPYKWEIQCTVEDARSIVPKAPECNGAMEMMRSPWVKAETWLG